MPRRKQQIYQNNSNSGFIINDKCIIKSKTFLTSDGIRLSYTYCKKKRHSKTNLFKPPSIILIHSFGYDNGYWQYLFNKLYKVSNIYALDILGTGNSDRPDNLARYTIDKLTNDIEEFMNKINVNKAYFVGHTFGGLLVLNFAALNPSRVIKIAVSSASPKFIIEPTIINLFRKAICIYEKKSFELEHIIRDITNRIDPDPVNCKKQRILQKQYKSTLDEYKIYLQIIELFNIKSVLPQIVSPTLIMFGSCDPISSIDAARFIHNEIVNSTIVEISGYGNNFPILNNTIYNKYIFDFFFTKADPCYDYLSIDRCINQNADVPCYQFYTDTQVKIFSNMKIPGKNDIMYTQNALQIECS